MSERLKIHPDVLKNWQNSYTQSQKEQKANTTFVKGKKYVTSVVRCSPNSAKKIGQNNNQNQGKISSKLAAEGALLAKGNNRSSNALKLAQKSVLKSLQRAKISNSSKGCNFASKEKNQSIPNAESVRVQTPENVTKSVESPSKKTPSLPVDATGRYILDPTSDPNFKDNFYVIFDKGASEMSSSDTATSDPDFVTRGQAVLAGGQRSLHKDVSLFVCESCRQIFRFSNTFKSHVKSSCIARIKKVNHQMFL